MSNGYRHYSGVFGSKEIYVGQDPDIYNFTDIASAISAAQWDDIIMIAPGTYTLTTALSINKPLTIMGMGGANDVVITSALATHTALINMPATGTAAAQTFKFRNLKFANTSTGDCVEIDNDGGLAQDMYIDFQDCSFVSASGVGIDLDQTTATKDVFLTVSGNPVLHSIAASTFGLAKAGSTVVINGMQCTGAFALSTENVAYIFNMIGCMYASQAQTTGGSASAITNHVGNFYGASLWAAAITSGAANDFDATSSAEYFASFAATTS